MVDIQKQYRTKNGCEVRIYSIDGSGKYPIHGAVKLICGWRIETWAINGDASYDDVRHDLVEVKPRIKRTHWYNVYPNPEDCNIASTKEDADFRASDNRIACVKVEIDCEEGEGL